MAKQKKKRDKKISKASIANKVTMRQTMMIQRYMTYLHSTINKLEEKGTIKHFKESFDEILVPIMDKKYVPTGDAAVDSNTMWNIIYAHLNLPEKIENINSMLNTTYGQKDKNEYPLYDKSNIGGLKIAIGRTTRRITFNLVYKNYLLEISYILSMGISESDIDDLIDGNSCDHIIDGVGYGAYTSKEFVVDPITRVNLTVKEMTEDKNLQIKQGNVVKHTPIVNKLFITCINEEDAEKIKSLSMKRNDINNMG